MKSLIWRRVFAARWFWSLAVVAVVVSAPRPGVAQGQPVGASGVNWATKTMDEIRQGAEKGDSVAQRVLGNAYLTGQGMQQNLAQAVVWFLAGAAVALAGMTLGLLF